MGRCLEQNALPSELPLIGHLQRNTWVASNFVINNVVMNGREIYFFKLVSPYSLEEMLRNGVTEVCVIYIFLFFEKYSYI